jgi:hypothetical protein
MSWRGLALSVVAVAAMAAFVVWLLELTLEQALLLAPLIVISAGVLAGLALLWTRAAIDTVRRRGSGY